MAPIGSVIKNGLLFLLLLAPIAWGSGLLFSAAIVDLNFASNDENGVPIKPEDVEKGGGTYYNRAIQYFAIGIVLLFGLGGLVFMKSLSDTVEDGMVEF